MYTIVIEKNVIKQLARIPSSDYKKIKPAINSSSENP
jgi:mRNA-degrading endonuclease RelE of RelBE toxin-antitoxin system